MKKHFFTWIGVILFVSSPVHAKLLADQETLRAQLVSVTQDSRFVDYFVPSFLQLAEEEDGCPTHECIGNNRIVDIFMKASATFTLEIDLELSKKDESWVLLNEQRSAHKDQLDSLIPTLIQAVLPNHPEEAAKAIQIWEKKLSQLKIKAAIFNKKSESEQLKYLQKMKSKMHNEMKSK